jgi:hypothetical protein
MQNKNFLHILHRGDSIMKVKYEEIGTFDAEKAARALIELTHKIKKPKNQNNKVNDKENDKDS